MKFLCKLLKKSKSGQAVFEFILFLPFMLLIYSVVVSICSAINGSINQQKAARGYLFARIKNNSNIPLMSSLTGFSDVKSAGMVTMGWREKSVDNDRPVAPCYQMKTFFAPAATDNCLTDPRGGTTSQFIRVKTAFGLCGNTYNINSPTEFIRSSTQASSLSCVLSESLLSQPVPI